MDRGKAVLTRRRLIASSAASVLAPNVITRSARAEAWPNRSVRMIVPLAAGGPTDSVARVLSEQLSKRWGQQVVIENKSGGGTNIGNAYVAHADPDGYTVLYGTSSLAVNATLYHALDYDPVADLAPVSLVAKFPFFMFVPNSLPATTVAEFVAYVKSRPGKLVMGSPGTGSAPHLAEEFFLQKAGIQMTHAPYRGAAPAFIDLIPGRIDCYFGSGELLTYSRSGQVRALGTTGSKRAPAEPDLPTIAEAGVAGYVVELVAGRVCAEKDTAGHRQENERRYRRRSGRAGDCRAARAFRLCGARLFARGAAGFSQNRCRKVERRHQDGGIEDRLTLHRLAAYLADHLHPLLNLIEGAFIFGAIARWLQLGLDIGGVGHDQSYSDYSLVEHDLFGKPVSILGSSPRTGFFRIMLWRSDRARRCRR